MFSNILFIVGVDKMQKNTKLCDDVITITNTIFDQFIPDNKPLQSKINLYDVYRALNELIYSINLVSKHYLALDFSEDFLQNSSYGKPQDKWRFFLNKDLEKLNKAVQKYLLSLSNIALEDDSGLCSSFMSELYNSKVSYAFIKYDYNIGFIEPCSLKMISTTLNTVFDTESHYISKFNTINLDTYEKRLDLQSELRNSKSILDIQRNKVKEYIIKNYTLEDLL